MNKLIAPFLAFILSMNLIVAQDTLLYEDFSAGVFPAGWSNINNDGHSVHPTVIDFADPWVVIEDPQNTSNFVVGSTSYFDPVDRADRWLITPEMTLGESGNFISWFGRSHDASFPDSYKVLISTTGDALSDFIDTLVIVSSEFPTGNFRNFEIDEKFADSTIRFAFVNNTFNGFKLYLDSICVRKGDPLNVNNIEINDVTIFPNPTSDYLNIKSSFGVARLELYSYSGKLVKTLDNSNILSVSDCNKGFYFLTIYLENGTLIRGKKVLVK
jgi:hypothetical protein